MAQNSNSNRYYNAYVNFKEKEKYFKNELNIIDEKKKIHSEQKDYVFNFKASVINVRVEVNKVKKYLQMVSIDGTPYDKDACNQNYNKLTEIYDYMDNVYSLIHQRIIQLNQEYDTIHGYYINALQNKRRNYDYYLDALNKEKSSK